MRRKKEILDVQYLNSEHLGDGYGDRRAIFDVYCQTEDGGRFIVEMQKADQDYFKDRSLYYSTFAIREQAPKGREWDYHLEDVFTIGVLNFKFPESEYPADKWMYVIRNLSRLLDRPKALQDRIFEKLFEQAEIAKYTPEERREYEVSVKTTGIIIVR